MLVFKEDVHDAGVKTEDKQSNQLTKCVTNQQHRRIHELLHQHPQLNIQGNLYQ